MAGLIEIARVLKTSEKELDFQVQFVAYANEKPPFYATEYMGSHVHAKSLKEGGASLELAVVLEMIGYFSDAEDSQRYPSILMKPFYPSKGDFIAAVSDFRSLGWVRRMKGVITPLRNDKSTGREDIEAVSPPAKPPEELHWGTATRAAHPRSAGGRGPGAPEGHTGAHTMTRAGRDLVIAQRSNHGSRIRCQALAAPRFLTGVDFSDHRSYWNFGFPALMVTNTSFYRTPNYHEATDVPSTLDYDRMRHVALGVAAFFLRLDSGLRKGSGLKNGSGIKKP